ncbi:MAG: ABC transporter ATP-binding protein [Ardenticatenaceae bacterium]|nr:ABC transporter ATP-binding protein [Ardenticatenaceae bacterium]HBY97281.1 methionine ABC transporter ATP-binding protein [Chloroflexota bacterium]
MGDNGSRRSYDDSDILLEVKNLRTYFFTEEGTVKAVDGVDLRVARGEALGLVGESGCGKSVTSLSIMRLVDSPGRIVEGQIFFDGQNLLDVPEREMCHIRGNRISMIFQQPISSLNPVFKVGDQIAEVLEIHQSLGAEAGRKRAVEMLRLVGIPDAERRYDAFPHELSGGMAQRVMIAMALATVPDLLIADEPTTALDVTIQAQILDLMRELRERVGTTIVLITHDLGVVAEMADNVAVMYAGQIVEYSDVFTIFGQPKHPYTLGLLHSIPILGQVREQLDVIPGSVPSLVNLPKGCRFANRCEARVRNDLHVCTAEDPPMYQVGPDHIARCFLYDPDLERKEALARQSHSTGEPELEIA